MIKKEITISLKDRKVSIENPDKLSHLEVLGMLETAKLLVIKDVERKCKEVETERRVNEFEKRMEKRKEWKHLQ